MFISACGTVWGNIFFICCKLINKLHDYGLVRIKYSDFIANIFIFETFSVFVKLFFFLSLSKKQVILFAKS